MSLELFFGCAMLLSVISGRITLLSQRSGIQRPLDVRNAVLDVVSTIAGLSFWAIIVWGLSSLNWYVALPIILAAAIIGGFLPNPPRFEFFYRIERFIDFCVVAVTIWLWGWNWPY
jgi:hypothetical protein